MWHGHIELYQVFTSMSMVIFSVDDKVPYRDVVGKLGIERSSHGKIFLNAEQKISLIHYDEETVRSFRQPSLELEHMPPNLRQLNV
jgi:hypothetical protein